MDQFTLLVCPLSPRTKPVWCQWAIFRRALQTGLSSPFHVEIARSNRLCVLSTHILTTYQTVQPCPPPQCRTSWLYFLTCQFCLVSETGHVDRKFFVRLIDGEPSQVQSTKYKIIPVHCVRFYSFAARVVFGVGTLEFRNRVR